MAKRSKRYAAAVAGLDVEAVYELIDAIEMVKKTANAKFNETVEVAIRLGVDPRHGDQMVRGTTNLPHGTGKVRRVAVFAKGDKAEEALAAGADVVGDADLITRIQQGWREFDLLMATPDLMPQIGRALGRTLGPRMPSPRSGTVTNDIGKVNFTTDQLVENFYVLLNALLKARPSAAKGRYLKAVSISSTMGPGFQIDGQKAQSTAEKL